MPGRKPDMPSKEEPIEDREYEVRYAELVDAPALAKLHAEALPPGWPAKDFEAFFRPQRHVLKIAGGDDLDGFLVLRQAADEAEILTVAVREKARGRGLGFSLVSAALDLCRKQQVGRLYLEVAENNAAARRLYAKAGFSMIALRENYYQLGKTAAVSALILMLDLGLKEKSHNGR
jgi:ribosomal-protein-alanine N-acetyltransferase